MAALRAWALLLSRCRAVLTSTSGSGGPSRSVHRKFARVSVRHAGGPGRLVMTAVRGRGSGNGPCVADRDRDHRGGVARLAVLWAAFFNFIAFAFFGTVTGAILWNYTTWWLRLPTSSSHALIGGLVGAGLAKGGLEAIKASSVQKALVFLVVSPIAGLLVATGHLEASGDKLTIPLWWCWPPTQRSPWGRSREAGESSRRWASASPSCDRLAAWPPRPARPSPCSARRRGGPVSTTHTVAGAVTGVGAVTRAPRSTGRCSGRWRWPGCSPSRRPRWRRPPGGRGGRRAAAGAGRLTGHHGPGRDQRRPAQLSWLIASRIRMAREMAARAAARTRGAAWAGRGSPARMARSVARKR